VLILERGKKLRGKSGIKANKGTIEIRLDSVAGELAGILKLTVREVSLNWKTVKKKVKNISGVHDVFFVFKGNEGNLFNFNWWKFN
jgi:hypothetical protein